MDFKKYKSIEDASRKKYISLLKSNGLDSGEWVSTVKIHGANYSLWYDGNVVRRARRRGWIDDGAYYGDNTFSYDDNMRNLYQHLKKSNKDLKCITVFGEIFGGYYNHKDVKKSKNAVRVQKGVSYSPDNHFIIFDMMVDGVYLDHYKVFELANMFGFYHVPVIAIGSFDDLMKIDTLFEDPVYKMFNLPKIEENYAEGWVLKPVYPAFFPNGARIIFKGKNDKFKEKSKVRKAKRDIKLSDAGNMLKNEVESYITENRLRNVISHGDIINITDKDFGKLLKSFSIDVNNSFMKDHKETFDGLDKKEQKYIKKYMNNKCASVIRQNFVDIIDGMF